MADIFISYAREDGQLVRELVREFEQLGKTVFWDRDIAVGADFQQALETELEACSCVVVVWSKHSVRSEWVRAEAQNALTRHIMVPVQIDDEPPPIIFRHLETSQLQGFPAEHSAVSMTKLRNSINRTLGFDSVVETTLTEPIRNDPTLSVRLAQRVLDAMHDSDRVALDTCLNIQRTLNESLIRVAKGQTWPSLRTEVITAVARQLNADWLLYDLEHDSVLSAARPLDEPGCLGDFLRQAPKGPHGGEPVLSHANDPGAQEICQQLSCFWILTVGIDSSPIICFFGREQATVPVKLVQEELAYLGRATRLLESPGSGQ